MEFANVKDDLRNIVYREEFVVMESLVNEVTRRITNFVTKNDYTSKLNATIINIDALI